MSQHLNRLNNEEAAEFDKAFKEFCEAENQENKMNTDFYLTIMSKQGTDETGLRYCTLYYMAILNAHRLAGVTTPIFTSYAHPDKEDMITVGKAYAKRLNIIYREGDVE